MIKYLDRKYFFYQVLFFLVCFSLVPLMFGEFTVSLISKYLAFCICAIGLNLLWGYLGLLSLGQGVFFALGGYALAMYLKLQSEPLPDFMQWSGLQELPFFWRPFDNLWVAILSVHLVPVIAATLIGLFIFKSGIKNVYFTILTQALLLSFYVLFVGQQPYTGGTNGITNYTFFGGISLFDTTAVYIVYYVALIAVCFTLLIKYFLVYSSYGKIIQGVKDGENRLRFLGYRTYQVKVVVYVFAALISGIGGAVFCLAVGIASPSMMTIFTSIEFAIWVAIGGKTTLWGPVIGCLLVNISKSKFSDFFPSAWLYLYGILFILIATLFPDGIVGNLKKYTKRKLNKNIL